jgi:hypothetical protein
MIRKYSLWIVVVLAVASLILGVVASPLIIEPLVTTRRNWPLLSDIGQSYGVASALFSALAFFGVALALILQALQRRESGQHSTDEHLFTLLRLGMEDKTYLEAWGGYDFPPEIDRGLATYTNLVFNYIVSLYVTRVSSLEEIEYQARNIFDGALGRAYWATTRSSWLTVRSRAKKAIRIIETEYQKALVKGPPSRALPKSSPKENSDPTRMRHSLCFRRVSGFRSWLRA